MAASPAASTSAVEPVVQEGTAFDVGERDERADRDPVAVVDDLVGEPAALDVDQAVGCFETGA